MGLLKPPIFKKISDIETSLGEKAYVSITDYGNIDKTGVIDCTSIVQQAIDAVHNAGGGTVLFPEGTFNISNIVGTVQIPAHDDGTVQNGYGTTMSAETVYSINYSVKMYTNVRLKGKGEGVTILKGGYTYGNADLNQVLMFAFVDNSTPFYNGVKDLTIQNAFIGFAGLDNCLALACFEHLQFNNCAIGIYGKQFERCRFDEIYGQGTGSLVVVGGQWRSRNDNYNEQGGFIDKCWFNKITYVYQRTVGTNESNIDTFFDTYFFKTANNTTRLSSPIQASTVAKLLNFKGICGTAINILPRYWRPCNNNKYENFFIAYTFRRAVYGGHLVNNDFDNFNLESVGYQDTANLVAGIGQNPVGVNWNDPYLGENIRVPNMIHGSDGSCTAKNIQLQNSYLNQALDSNINYIGLSTSGNNNLTTSQPITNQTNVTLVSPTLNTPTLNGGSTTGDIGTNYHYIGTNSPFTWQTVTTGSATMDLTFPLYGIYLVNVMATGNGGYDHIISQAYLVTFMSGSAYAALGTDAIGTTHKASGSLTPSGIALSAPTSGGVITATISGCVTAQVAIRFDITKLSLS